VTVGTKVALSPGFKFVGNFPRSLDVKGRVILPSRMRAHFQDHGYLTPGADGCLALWPEEEFELEAERQHAKDSLGVEARNDLRDWRRSSPRSTSTARAGCPCRRSSASSPISSRRSFSSESWIAWNSGRPRAGPHAAHRCRRKRCARAGRESWQPRPSAAVSSASLFQLKLLGCPQPLGRSAGWHSNPLRPVSSSLRGMPFPRSGRGVADDPGVRAHACDGRRGRVDVRAGAPGILVDATVGGGGHAAALLTALPAHELIGLDVDDDAVTESAARLARFGSRARVLKARFDELAAVVRSTAQAAPVAGVLFDLGVSSPQLDRPERGFSYRFDGPLDMRMDRDRATTAADLVNGSSVKELTELLVASGEGRFARRLAEAIVGSRPIETTSELVAVIERYLPGVARKRPGHPAKRSSRLSASR